MLKYLTLWKYTSTDKYTNEEIKKLSGLVKEVVGGIKGKGFMYSLPISYLEGLDE